MRLARVYLWLLALGVTAAGLVVLNEMSGFVYLRQSDVAIAISLLITGYSIVGLCCAAVHDNGRLRRLMRVGMIMGLGGTACWIGLIAMEDLGDIPLYVTLAVALSSIAGAIAISGLLSLLPLRSTMHRGMRVTAIVGLALLAAYVVGAFALAPQSPYPYGGWASADWQRYHEYEESAYRIGSAMAMLTGLLTAATLVVGVLDLLTARGRPPVQPARSYWLQCPRCGCEQNATTGEHRCARCGLRTKVELT